MRPENTLDWTAFVLLLIGAFAWGYFVTDVNILDVVLERIWDPLDDVVFVLIAASGFYWLVRVLAGGRRAVSAPGGIGSGGTGPGTGGRESPGTGGQASVE